ncbi:MAG: FYDLN acid domain-containing protein [Alphaproteobacteria bacterium]|nr:FYDLN acid domain-containing protein [Alphaproteobacteria bacterium]MDA8004900.1 FYDLN acid domain-containing protein [Alphaproteobacteria bacterium]MDA8006542.1 FYDLN acid domain-containing protein [Alphaproteobacteria bacterium]MDA8013478.1 FYDLN acid domain-containing protein [Alphaproteobacteria bacterium]
MAVVSLSEEAAKRFGFRRVCANCGTAFYDKDRWPVDCPKCGATYQVHAMLKGGARSIPARRDSAS